MKTLKPALVLVAIVLLFGAWRYGTQQNPEQSATPSSSSSQPEPTPASIVEDCYGDLAMSEHTWVSSDGASGRARDILQTLNTQYAQGTGIGSGNLADLISPYATETSLTAIDPTTGTSYRVVRAKWCEDYLGTVVTVLVDETHKRALSLLADENVDIISFSDLDRDGVLELITHTSGFGNCWGCTHISVYRVRKDRIEDVLSPVISEQSYAPSDIFPLPTGMPGFGIRVWDTRWEGKLGVGHCCGPSAEKYFSVNGKAVRDITRELYLFGQMIYFAKEKKAIYDDSGIPLSRLVSVLLQYEAAGERKQGFEYFMKEYPHAAKASINDELSEDWAKGVLKEIQRQYREQKSFTPFD